MIHYLRVGHREETSIADSQSLREPARPAITIGLPVYNQEQTIGAAIRSVFAQTYPDWELIIVCDGSPPHLVERLHCIEDRRVRVLVHKRNRGLAGRLNEISELARGRYIARMDADDIMHPERLERQVRYMDEARCQVLGTRAYVIDEYSHLRGIYRERTYVPTTLDGFLENNVVTHPTVVYQTDWARSHPYNASYRRSEDKELWIRVFADTVFDKLPEPLLFYRIVSSVDLRQYLRSAKYDRMAMSSVGSNVASSTRLSRIAFSHVKSIVAGGLVLLDGGRRLQARRYDPLSAAEVRPAEQLLSRVDSTPIPGWEV